MPNWTGNLLKVKGKKADRDLFASELKAFIRSKFDAEIKKWAKENPDKCRNKYEKSIVPVFDFNFVIPMPEELEGTTSPRPMTREQIICLAKDNEWPEDTLKWRLEHALTEDDAKRLDELQDRYGFDNWYDWCCANWGTKWNACHSEGHSPQETATMTTYSFDTAWSPPTPVIHALAAAYPKLTFRLDYTLEGESGKWNIIGDSKQYSGCIKALAERQVKLEQTIRAMFPEGTIESK
jgi:hypothetical protein